MWEGTLSSDTDWNPWAAYVVGHHPHSLQVWLEGLWVDINYNGSRVSEQSWLPITTEIRELNTAMRILAIANQAKAAALVEMHRVVDEFEMIVKEMIESPELYDQFQLGKDEVPGQGEGILMRFLSKHIIDPSGALQPWHQLGDALGRGQLSLRTGIGFHAGELPEEIQNLAQRLDGHLSETLREEIKECILDIRAALSLEWVRARLCALSAQHLKVAHLDGKLRAELRNLEAPEPFLVLTNESITFFGVEHPMAKFGPNERNCLWILAERAGTPVPRREIIEFGKLQTDEKNLQFVVQRVKKTLYGFVEEYCSQTGNDRPRGFDRKNIITGRRLPQSGQARHSRGPFTLNLDPARVEVIYPRQEGMQATPAS